MKKVLTFVWPFLILFLALGFMSQYKQLDNLSDAERYEVRTFVEAVETRDSNGNEKSEDQEDSQTASASVNETTEEDDVDIDVDVDPTKSYEITSNEGTVRVHEDNGKVVFTTSMDDWEEHREDYYEKYQLEIK